MFDGTVQLDTMKNWARNINKQLRESDDDLFGENSRNKELEFKKEILIAVVNYKEDMAEKARKAALTRKANAEEKERLLKIRDEKTYEKEGKKSLKAIEQRLEELGVELK